MEPYSERAFAALKLIISLTPLAFINNNLPDFSRISFYIQAMNVCPTFSHQHK